MDNSGAVSHRTVLPLIQSGSLMCVSHLHASAAVPVRNRIDGVFGQVTANPEEGPRRTVWIVRA